MEFIRKYRPSSLMEIFGNDVVKVGLGHLLRTGLGGRRILFVGESGTGKTTLARIIANETERENRQEFNASDINFDWIRQFGYSLRLKSLYPGLKCWIINEAQRLNKPVQDRLLTLIEDMPDSNVVVFTTTEPEKLQPAFMGRCLVFRLETPTVENLSDTARLVIRREGAKITKKAALLIAEQADEQRTGYRGVLQLLEQAVLAGCVDQRIFAA